MLTPMLAQILIMVSITYLWLFLNGDQYTVITGGWISQAWSGSPSWSATGLSLSISTTMAVILSGINTSGRSSVTRVTDLIDLTAISKIRITVSGTLSGKDAGGTAFQRIYIFTSAATTGYWTSPDVYTALILAHEHVPAYLSASETLDGAQYMLDVSALTGYHRVCIGFAWQYQSNISYIKVSSVEMLTA